MTLLPENYPLVSVVIPAYNAEGYLSEAIESVLAQTYENIELLVFDDGSTDKTKEVLQRYGSKFYWESHPNIGQAASLNKGWQMSKGSILSYLSADDALKPDAVQESVDYLVNQQDVVMVYGDYDLIDENSVFVKSVQAPEFNYTDMVVNIVVQPGPGVFFRRSAFEKMGGWNSSLRQIPDFEYWLRLGLLGCFKRLPLVVADYRVHKDSQSYIEPSFEKAEECVTVMRGYFLRDDIPKNIRALENIAMSSAHIISARFHLRAARYQMTWRRVMQAWRCSKRNTLSVRTFRLLGNGLVFCFSRRLRGSA